MKKLLLILLAVMLSFTFIACEPEADEPTKFTVTFNVDGTKTTEKVEEGKKVSEPETDPTKKGYTFVEWQLEEVAYDFDSEVTKDIELVATWDRDETVWDGTEKDVSWYDEAESSFTITKASELAGLAKIVNEGNSLVGKTITLGNDLDLGDYDWTPIGNFGDHGKVFNGTFDGADYTIKNLVVDSSAIEESSYCSGLFGTGTNVAVIKNLTIDTAEITGHHWVGTVIGYIYGTVTNCHVKNATIINTHANDDACGDKTGAVVGFWPADNNNVITNCSAEDCTIKGSRDAGQIVGAAKEIAVDTTTCSATNVTVTANDDCTGANVRNELIGRLL